ncbi:MAG: hypothetical protein U1E43_07715 [Rhodospirillales bacterium]
MRSFLYACGQVTRAGLIRPPAPPRPVAVSVSDGDDGIVVVTFATDDARIAYRLRRAERADAIAAGLIDGDTHALTARGRAVLDQGRREHEKR